MLFYFSATGNSRWVARQLAGCHEALFQMAGHSSWDRDYVLSEGEAVGFVFPVYAWGPPTVVLRFIASVRLVGQPSFVYFVCTCGDDTGRTAEVFCRAVSRRGWTCEAGYSVVLPNTYVCLPGFDVDSEEAASRKLEAAWKRMAVLQRRIAAREKGFDCNEGQMPWIKTYVIRALFNCFLMFPGRFRVTDGCVSCGICAKVCPLQNIRMEKTPVWGKDCAMCLACYHHCPKHAVAYGSQTKGKGQYVFRGAGEEIPEGAER